MAKRERELIAWSEEATIEAQISLADAVPKIVYLDALSRGIDDDLRRAIRYAKKARRLLWLANAKRNGLTVVNPPARKRAAVICKVA